MDQRKYAIVLWGATGFTGTLIAEYLDQQIGADHRWAIAGRNLTKLQEVKEKHKLKRNPPDIITASLEDKKSLEQMVGQARVVINSAGPFQKFGTPVVEACVKMSAHYCDITGEFQWVRSIIDQFHAVAQKKDLKIVTFCGLESVPSDMGTMYICEYVQRELHRKVKWVDFFFDGLPVSGGVSGGTLAASLEMMSPSNIKALVHPNYLDPQVKMKDRLEIPLIPGYNRDIHQWYLSFPLNSRTVRRTQALLENPYGTFSYREGIAGSIFSVLFLAFSLLVIFLIALFPPAKMVMQRLVPPGTGPSRKEMNSRQMHAKIIAYTQPQENEKPKKVIARLKGEGDPGYLLTAKMVGQVALCLAFDPDLPPTTGVVTPASGLGMPLLNRLQKRNVINFSIEQ